jgi:hypothetical protein
MLVSSPSIFGGHITHFFGEEHSSYEFMTVNEKHFSGYTLLPCWDCFTLLMVVVSYTIIM